jgi:hypothetical protein
MADTPQWEARLQARAILEEKELPAEYARLLDPAQPLPPAVRHFAMAPPTGQGVVGWAISAGVCLLLSVPAGFVWLVSAKGEQVTRTSPSNPFLTCTFFLVLIGLGCGWKAMNDHRRLKLLKSGGGNRFGVFLAPDALVVRGDLCRFFPREAVLAYTVERTEKDGVTFVNTSLKYRNAEGIEAICNNPEDCLEKPLRLEAAEAIRAWANAEAQ